MRYLKSSDNTRRIFIALPAPAEVMALQNNLRSDISSSLPVKWIPSPNIHLTLYFIGDLHYKAVDEISKIITPIIHSQKRFTLLFDSVCLFPFDRPRMVWARYKQHDTFTLLSKLIHNSLKEYISEDKICFKEPVPHITLARFHTNKKLHSIKLPEKISLPDISINSCELWETIKANGVSTYRSVISFNF